MIILNCNKKVIYKIDFCFYCIYQINAAVSIKFQNDVKKITDHKLLNGSLYMSYLGWMEVGREGWVF